MNHFQYLATLFPIFKGRNIQFILRLLMTVDESILNLLFQYETNPKLLTKGIVANMIIYYNLDLNLIIVERNNLISMP